MEDLIQRNVRMNFPKHPLRVDVLEGVTRLPDLAPSRPRDLFLRRLIRSYVVLRITLQKPAARSSV
jgi:hypothetical protein